MSLRFEWDENKAKLNLNNHKIDFQEATTVFADTLSLTIPDPLHSVEEERFITIGLSYRQNMLVIVHCERKDKIRIISARKATKHERKTYEETRR